ncbi:hypothetical protein [Glutamicibacter sp. PS]|uniref:hypothetical protein n=1 Tax=Glutamicibacter sp. PS TaxID=3075634 RepID=UPI002842DE7F|nr:hypothetical protein [Glutamicibacter sp. PS]MDR4533235.1 hypothetical protein [Glutamicibacter sp. PS]
MHSADQIRARASRRMWMIYLPTMTLILIVILVTASIPSGVSTLMMLFAGGLAIGAWCDLLHADAVANALESTHTA